MIPARDFDPNLYSPANWPNYSLFTLRIGWINDGTNRKEDSAEILKIIPHIRGSQLLRLNWEEVKTDPFKVVLFFEQVEVVIWLKEFHNDPMILSVAAAMGRVVLTDSVEHFPFNHGENAMVVTNDTGVLAKALIFLNTDPKFRATLGKNFRRSFLELQKNRA